MSKIYTQVNTFLFIFVSVDAFEIYYKENTLFSFSIPQKIALLSSRSNFSALFYKFCTQKSRITKLRIAHPCK